MQCFDQRLALLRSELAQQRLDGFVVPLTDEHMSEYVGTYAQRLGWLTGFKGSAGTAVVLSEDAAIFVDGRYTLQVRDQVNGSRWSFHTIPQTNVAKWLRENAPNNARIGYDPWLHTKGWVEAIREVLKEHDGELVSVEVNPIDAIWQDQPAPSQAKIVVYPDGYAGRSSPAKRHEIGNWLKAEKADTVLLAALDSIAWTFNIRGKDVARTPVALSFALVHSDGTADLFVAREKLDMEVRRHLGDDVRIYEKKDFELALSKLSGKVVALDPERSVAAIGDTLEKANATIIERRDPTVLAKAIKNPIEIAGHKAAQERDGVALTRFLYWLATEAPKGHVTEWSAAAKLQALREETGALCDLSFDTISGVGPNGAVIHYRVSERSSRNFVPGTLYLVDSGGQYLDGTTDVTRTVAIGTPDAEMRERFTRVLKGHIALASAVFPKGTHGGQLDVLARQYLWEAGLDYATGTGHGVGFYLSVHEGPHKIARIDNEREPLLPGMILSNEPGYYKAGAYGIRIENLFLVVEHSIEGSEQEMLGFEALSFAPIDRTLIDISMLSDREIEWIDTYHRSVGALIGPQLDQDDGNWLRQATRPLKSDR